jgi:hypothetical protein
MLLLSSALVIAACAPNSSNPSATATLNPTAVVVETSSLPTDEAGLPLVADVNGTGITLSDYELQVHRLQSQPFANPDQLPQIVLKTMI